MILIEKKTHTLEEAKKKASKHGKTDNVITAKKFYKFQQNKKNFKKEGFRLKRVDGVLLVMGVKKGE